MFCQQISDLCLAAVISLRVCKRQKVYPKVIAVTGKETPNAKERT